MQEYPVKYIKLKDDNSVARIKDWVYASFFLKLYIFHAASVGTETIL